jgi:hypothetical protein
MSEPKGDCPFCNAPKWHVCKHFAGYVRSGKLYIGDGKNRLLQMPKDTVCVDTGVSVRAYRRA